MEPLILLGSLVAAWGSASASVWQGILSSMSEATMLLVWGTLLLALGRTAQIRTAPIKEEPEQLVQRFGSAVSRLEPGL